METSTWLLLFGICMGGAMALIVYIVIDER
jgi:hypothetical protein